MKAYNIYDEELRRSLGTLLYYEKDHSWIIELIEELDEWTAPLLFTGFVKNKIFTIPREFSAMWVNERIIPSGRQNIGSILTTHHLKEYDEMKFLEIAEGRCSQDMLCIHKINELPEYVLQRMNRNLTDITICNDDSLLCFFKDNTIRKIHLTEFIHEDNNITKILNNRALFESGTLTPDGYAVTFNNAIDIMASQLYSSGTKIPLEKDDFIAFVKNTVADTSQACNILECSRQNLSYIVNNNRLRAYRKEVKGALYSKGDILKTQW
ncbi:MAG: hypothetical protein IKR11_06450 [Solobacterium sp.]|nr:hypothetical protein [Solobacterium sp.]